MPLNYTHLQRRIPANIQPDHPTDPFGIDDWSASRCMDPATGFALAASVLSGLAGPMHLSAGEDVIPVRAGFNLLGSSDDVFVATTIRELTASAFVYQDAVQRQSRGLTIAAIEAARLTPSHESKFALNSLKPAVPSDDPAHIPPMPAEKWLEADAARSFPAVRCEALMRPRTLMNGTLPNDLGAALAECHEGRGFSAGCIERLPQSAAARNQRIDTLIRMLNGSVTTASKTKTPVPATLREIQLFGILLLPQPDFDSLIKNGDALLSLALPVRSNPETSDETLDEARSCDFIRFFSKMVRLAFAHRRASMPLTGTFKKEEAYHVYLARQRTYQHELQAVEPSRRFRCLADLPAVMTWMLLFMADEGGFQLADPVLASVFTSARRLRDDTCRLLDSHHAATDGRQRLDLARKLVNRLTKAGPCKRRHLLRGLNDQSLDTNGPVISALVQLGIFVESPEGVLSIGSVPLNQISPQLLLQHAP